MRSSESLTRLARANSNWRAIKRRRLIGTGCEQFPVVSAGHQHHGVHSQRRVEVCAAFAADDAGSCAGCYLGGDRGGDPVWSQSQAGGSSAARCGREVSTNDRDSSVGFRSGARVRESSNTIEEERQESINCGPDDCSSRHRGGGNSGYPRQSISARGATALDSRLGN